MKMGQDCNSGGDCGSGHGGCCQPKKHDMGNEIFDLAHQAWEELMVEKMKKEFEKANGARMNKVAKVAVDSTNAYWQNFMQKEAGHQEYEQKLNKAFMS